MAAPTSSLERRASFESVDFSDPESDSSYVVEDFTELSPIITSKDESEDVAPHIPLRTQLDSTSKAKSAQDPRERLGVAVETPFELVRKNLAKMLKARAGEQAETTKAREEKFWTIYHRDCQRFNAQIQNLKTEVSKEKDAHAVTNIRLADANKRLNSVERSHQRDLQEADNTMRAFYHEKLDGIAEKCRLRYIAKWIKRENELNAKYEQKLETFYLANQLEGTNTQQQEKGTQTKPEIMIADGPPRSNLADLMNQQLDQVKKVREHTMRSRHEKWLHDELRRAKAEIKELTVKSRHELGEAKKVVEELEAKLAINDLAIETVKTDAAREICESNRGLPAAKSILRICRSWTSQIRNLQRRSLSLKKSMSTSRNR